MPVAPPEPKVGRTPLGTVCDRAARTFAREALDAAKSFQNHGLGAMESMIARFSKVTTFADRLGPAGQEASRMIKRVSHNSQRIAGEFLRDLDRVSRLPKAAQIAAAKAHYYGTGKADLSPDAVKAYDLLDGTFGKILRTAQALGVKRTLFNGSRVPIKGSGRGYPTLLSRRGQQIMREAARDRRSADAIDAAATIVARNHPNVTDLTKGMGAADLKVAHKIALGHTPDGASAAAKRAGEAIAENIEWGFGQMRLMHLESKRGIVPYLERPRLELPDHMLNFDPVNALPGFYRHQGLMLSAFREWGQGMEGWRNITGRIQAENSAQHADLLDKYVTTALGRPKAGLPEENELLGIARNYTMLRIFGGTVLGPLRNLGQPFTNGVDQPVGAWIASYKELPPFLHRWVDAARDMREMVIESGARTSEQPQTEFAGAGRLGPVAKKAASAHVTGIAENEFRAAVVGYLGAQQNIARLVEMQGPKGPIAKVVSSLRHLSTDPEAATARALERTGVSRQRIDQIRKAAQEATPEQLKEMVDKPSAQLTHEEWLTVMQRASIDTQFGYTFANRHVFSGQDDAWGVVFMLKNWGVRQLGYIQDHVLSEAAQGNAKPLVKLIGTTWLLGEIYNNIGDEARGTEKSVRKRVQADRDAASIARATMRNIGDGGGVGILMDAMWGWSNAAFGPLGGTVMNTMRGAGHVVQNPGQAATAAKDFLDKEFVVTAQARGAWNKIKAANDAKHERFFDYGTWRDRSFDYVATSKSPSVAEQGADFAVRFLKGDGRPFPGPRTLTYEQAAKSITANDIDGASQHIRRLLETAEDRAERAAILRGIKASSRARSPLGPVKQSERTAFLRQYPVEERRKALQLQRAWERDFDSAIRRAQRRKQ